MQEYRIRPFTPFSSDFVFKITYKALVILLSGICFVLLIKSINFWGDLTDISAETATLLSGLLEVVPPESSLCLSISDFVYHIKLTILGIL